MTRLILVTVSVTLAIAISACSRSKKPEPTSTTEVKIEAKSGSAPQPTTPSQNPGDLQVGQASGSYTAKGETVELKYAYAGRGVRFGTESIIVLVTDKPIPAEAVAQEINSQTLLLDEKIRGLEYVIDKESMWVRFHPGQYQESSSNKLKEYKVEGDIVRGVDDNDGNLTDGKYSRKIKFVASITK